MRMSQRESEAGSTFWQVAAANSAASWHGDVGLLGDLLQKKRPMRFELGMAASAAGLGGKASRHTKGLHQVDDKGNRHPQMRRGRAPRMTFIDIADNALTQIKRIPLRHRESPPFGSQSRRPLRSS